ncbi:MAG: LytTR family DNA-binding domain-containing protein [Pseudomonadales bacterium]|nr:LytTR family DNA-binding domain-containing protein [Pseudomonadales bacterium]
MIINPEPRTVLIAEDEPLALKRIKRMVDELEGYQVIGTAQNGFKALDAAQSLQPDILLTDISMPGMGGLELARRLDNEPVPPALIFLTAYDQYALDAFDVHAAGYLLKPIRKEDLQVALKKTQKSNRMQISTRRSQRRRKTDRARRSHISVKGRQGVNQISVDSIYCFIADQKYLTIHHSHGIDLIDETLKNIEQEFDDTFIRIHRNALVAIDAIEQLESVDGAHQLHLKKQLNIQEPLMVSRRHLPALRKLLTRQ